MQPRPGLWGARRSHPQRSKTNQTAGHPFGTFAKADPQRVVQTGQTETGSPGPAGASETTQGLRGEPRTAEALRESPPPRRAQGRAKPVATSTGPLGGSPESPPKAQDKPNSRPSLWGLRKGRSPKGWSRQDKPKRAPRGLQAPVRLHRASGEPRTTEAPGSPPLPAHTIFVEGWIVSHVAKSCWTAEPHQQQWQVSQ